MTFATCTGSKAVKHLHGGFGELARRVWLASIIPFLSNPYRLQEKPVMKLLYRSEKGSKEV
ncbi:hypothetical protein HQ36_06165 [Porphyromonas gingivicanis]|uniref:Uncharacterized protein n=1 Tax=Porphyromonas gingivicanis TaxID=266762 RepID=A0A0A2G541_9PORP|nr:hypothetical protein HQ36_06165 [Porphyromonas gingivicanis]